MWLCEHEVNKPASIAIRHTHAQPFEMHDTTAHYSTTSELYFLYNVKKIVF